MKKIVCALLLSCLFISFSHAQKREVVGKVIDKNTKQPLEGVNIMVDKSKTGAATKSDGFFKVNLKSSKSILIFSSIGYATQTAIVEKTTDTIIVAMIPASTDNAEVVVIGYGTQRRSDVTGAISKFKDEKLDEAPVSRLDQALQGKIAGVQVENVSSEAGAPPKVTVRGISSVYAGASPLVVVDGQPVPDGLAFVNMSDIESVEVLKDAASAAIYGSRGASGVILITTKTGKSDKPKYVFKYSVGAKQDYKRYDVFSTTEYMNNLFYEASLKAMDPSVPVPVGQNIASNNERSGYIIENQIRGGRGTDWQSEALRTGLFQNINLTASGGKSDIKYYVSGGYQKDQGLMRNSEYERFNFRTKIDVNLSKKVKLTVNLNPSYSRKESPSINYTTFVRYPSFLPVAHTQSTLDLVYQNPQWSTLQVGSYAQPRHFSNLNYTGYMPDGSFWDPGANSDAFNSSTNSPVSILNNTTINTEEYRLQTSADLTVKLSKGLDFKSLATMYVNNNNGLNWSNRNAEADGLVSRGVFNNNSFVDLLAEQTLTYNKIYKDHTINAVAGFTSQITRTRNDQAVGLDFPNDNIRTLNNASIIDKSGTYTNTNKIGLLSYLGRVNYNYKNKYLLSASFRTDGSSYFGPGNKWGTFPSVSLGWIMDKEKFMKNVNWISKLKWRASYGISGNNRILNFGFLDLLYPTNYAFGTGTGTVNPGQSTSSTIRSNKDITWESTYQANFGMDLSVLKGKISLTADYYMSTTDKLLLQQSAVAYSGVPANWNNIGSLKNNGIELQLNTINLTKRNFKWTTSANFSHTQNEIKELGNEAFLLNEGERNELYLNKVGNPLIQFYGYKTDGIWLSQAQIDAAIAGGLSSPLSNAFVPGQLKLVDLNGDNVIDTKDRTIIGSPYPDFSWGMTHTITYKQFDVSLTFQGVQGGSLINGDPNYDDVKKLVVNYNENRWISPMFPGDGKTPNYNKAAFNWLLTDYVVEDASYYALREVNIGYKFTEAAISKLKLNGLRVYFSAQNLFYHTAKGYRGLNPEARISSGPYSSSLITGYQRGAFPIPQTFVIGVDVNF
jgi:TonB-linked SusC/RagA family outer membrane protein